MRKQDVKIEMQSEDELFLIKLLFISKEFEVTACFTAGWNKNGEVKVKKMRKHSSPEFTIQKQRKQSEGIPP